MCGRGRQTAVSAQAVAEALQIPAVFRPQSQVQQAPADDDLDDQYSPFSNGAPGRTAPIVLEGPPEEPATLTIAKWGLVPSYQKPDATPDYWRMFNAREDNLSNVHARLLSTHRCVVPFDGFYEWENRVELGKKRKVPYYLSAKDGSQLHIAGLWDTWRNQEGKTIRSFTLITVSPSEDIKWLHDRMPAILQGPDEVKQWLDETQPYSKVKHLIRSFKVGGLKWWPVTENIGKLGYQGDDCITPVQLVKGTKPITSFFTKKSDKEEKKADVVDVDVDDGGAAKSSSGNENMKEDSESRKKAKVTEDKVTSQANESS